jgi:DNA-binding CsgD family transcriptional regulator
MDCPETATADTRIAVGRAAVWTHRPLLLVEGSPMNLGTFARELVEVSSSLDTAAAFRVWVLGRLRTIVPFDGAVYAPLTHGDRQAALDADPDHSRYYERFMERPGYYSPGIQKGLAAAAARGSFVDGEVYSSRERDRIPFFAELIRPQRISSQVVTVVDFHGRSRASIHLCRHGRATPFSSEHAALVARLLPTLALAQAAFDVAGASQEVSSRALDVLTERELAVSRLVARGLRNQDIATLLGTSPNTVRNQLASAFRKLGVRSRATLAAAVRADAAGAERAGVGSVLQLP